MTYGLKALLSRAVVRQRSLLGETGHALKQKTGDVSIARRKHYAGIVDQVRFGLDGHVLPGPQKYDVVFDLLGHFVSPSFLKKSLQSA
jgi:hypothetical protein